MLAVSSPQSNVSGRTFGFQDLSFLDHRLIEFHLLLSLFTDCSFAVFNVQWRAPLAGSSPRGHETACFHISSLLGSVKVEPGLKRICLELCYVFLTIPAELRTCCQNHIWISSPDTHLGSTNIIKRKLCRNITKQTATFLKCELK